MISGNTDGIKDSILSELEQIYNIQVDKNYILNGEIINIISSVTEIINREISVCISRKGKVISVSIGDSRSVEMPVIDVKERKLSSISIIHTHPNGNSNLSELDLSALTRLRLDYIAALGVENGICKEISFGFCNIMENKFVSEICGPLKIEEAFELNIMEQILRSEENIKEYEVLESDTERAILVSIDNNESLDELKELASACNVDTAYKILQKRDKIDTAFYVGSGKIEEISYLLQNYRANVVIFDDELSGSQIRNIEDMLGVKVIDRTTLILEIFAKRANTKEAKIQVELAQLKYRLPRLTGLGTVLSRTGGGIGTRGPGEKKLEIDKRHIRERIYDLNKELKKIKNVRKVQREKRNKGNVPKIALVGYTNAGKSTLRNKLCELYSPSNSVKKEKVFEANMLFATLDTTIRALELEDSRIITLTDTVGFISKLPHDLVEAFKSTLEEVIYADLLVHVVDASSEYALAQISVVNNVLKELNALDKPSILVLNKIDKSNAQDLDVIKDNNKFFDIIEISAKEEINLEKLIEEVSKKLPNTLKKCEFLIPYTHQAVVAYLHENAKINFEEYKENGTYIRAIVEEKIYNKYSEFVLK
ncbi:GTPase HflX [Haloimpatiens sp. FM7330]|uniref:GTPase HflX n=1 Tax=Haloimpatiens sp. FM7330 TaxID=3298610 RepID=UPI003634EF60